MLGGVGECLVRKSEGIWIANFCLFVHSWRVGGGRKKRFMAFHMHCKARKDVMMEPSQV